MNKLIPMKLHGAEIMSVFLYFYMCNQGILWYIYLNEMKWNVLVLDYLALSTSSCSSGTSRWTNIPRFIFAGSRAQFDIPIKETLEKAEFNNQYNICHLFDFHNFYLKIPFCILWISRHRDNHPLAGDARPKIINQ